VVAAALRVFVDANVLKFSASVVQRRVPVLQEVEWAGKAIQVPIHRVVQFNPNDSIANQDLKGEAELLPQVAALGHSGLVEYVVTFELQMEGWRLPSMPSRRGWFYGVPLTKVDAPFQYARTVAGGRLSPKELQHHFLASVRHPRFAAIQRAVGAYQGAQLPQRNQLLDAFHLWCAEHNACTYFLTLDFKLAKAVAKQQSKFKIQVVRPSELLRLVSRPA